MFYNAFGLFEHFEDVSNEIKQDVQNEIKQDVSEKSPDEIKQNYIQTGFNQTDTAIPSNLLQLKQKSNLELYNISVIDAENIKQFNNNTMGIQMNTVFDFTFSLIGYNKPFNTNIINYNKINNKNIVSFKYKDQYDYDINLNSNKLDDNRLYNILYLPIQSISNISYIDATTLKSFNLYNGLIITLNNDIKITLPYNKTFELYIFPLKQIKLTLEYFENKVSNFTLKPNVYSYLYYNNKNYEPISISELDIINLKLIMLPTTIELKDNNKLIYYNNFLNYNNNKFYNTVSKNYDTFLMNCNNCKENINSTGSRYSKLAYNGTANAYIKLPDLNLSNSVITFSINFKTNDINNNNQTLFDVGYISSDYQIMNSLFVNFENNTVRFNYIKDNILISTFLYANGNPKLNDNTWHNIIWTLNINNTWTIYIDSVIILDAPKISPNKNNFYCTSNNNFIGKKNDANKLYRGYKNYIGLIDNFKIYGKKLDAYDIKNENIK
jgi:hypothetical protein